MAAVSCKSTHANTMNRTFKSCCLHGLYCFAFAVTKSWIVHSILRVAHLQKSFFLLRPCRPLLQLSLLNFDLIRFNVDNLKRLEFPAAAMVQKINVYTISRAFSPTPTCIVYYPIFGPGSWYLIIWTNVDFFNETSIQHVRSTLLGCRSEGSFVQKPI